jgi:hypothetical protein
MSRVVRVTLVLAALLLVAVGADVAVHVSERPEVDELPRLGDVDLARVRTVRITRDGETIVMERVGDTAAWRLVQPVEGPADNDPLRTLFTRLRRGVPMQVQVDQGNLAEYGLESGKAIRLQVEQDEESEPVIDIYVGQDTVGGASFVRFPDDDVVYRAQVGGRHRLDRPVRAWRDPTVFAFEPDAASGLVLDLRPDGERLAFAKTEEGWILEGEPDFPIDGPTLEDTLERLGSLRAGRVLPSDFPLEGEPAFTGTVDREGLDPVTLRFYRQGELAYVTREGRDEVFQVGASALDRLRVPRQAWLDRQILDVERAQIQTMRFDRPDGRTFLLEQDAADSRWRVLEPRNMDANLREAMQAAVQLSRLRAEGIAMIDPAEAGFPSDVRFVLTLRDGTEHVVELGRRTLDPEGKPTLLFVRNPANPDRIGVLPLRRFLEFARAFGG